MWLDNFKIAFKNIKERKSRVFLTFLGIAIGIMAIVALMAIGEGMQEAVVGELSSLSDTVIVTPSSTITVSVPTPNCSGPIYWPEFHHATGFHGISTTFVGPLAITGDTTAITNINAKRVNIVAIFFTTSPPSITFFT